MVRPTDPTGPTNPTGPTSADVQSFRLLTFALVSGILFMGVALAFILTFAAPPVVALVVLLVIGVGAHLTIGAATSRIRPMSPGGDAAARRAAAFAAFRNQFMVRAVLAETPALLGIVLAFVSSPRAWLIYAVGAVISWALLALDVWPSRRTLEPIIDALESGGSGSGLRELFGFGPRDLAG